MDGVTENPMGSRGPEVKDSLKNRGHDNFESQQKWRVWLGLKFWASGSKISVLFGCRYQVSTYTLAWRDIETMGPFRFISMVSWTFKKTTTKHKEPQPFQPFTTYFQRYIPINSSEVFFCRKISRQHRWDGEQDPEVLGLTERKSWFLFQDNDQKTPQISFLQKNNLLFRFLLEQFLPSSPKSQ